MWYPWLNGVWRRRTEALPLLYSACRINGMTVKKRILFFKIKELVPSVNYDDWHENGHDLD
jgi:hypothetical protein